MTEAKLMLIFFVIGILGVPAICFGIATGALVAVLLWHSGLSGNGIGLASTGAGAATMCGFLWYVAIGEIVALP